MKTKLSSLKKVLFLAWLTLASVPLAALAATGPNVGYVQSNLVSNLPGIAKHQDPQALNSWGIAANTRSLWVAQNHAGVASGYGPSGSELSSSTPSDPGPGPYALARSTAFAIPGPAGSTNAGTPTGLILNDTHQFIIANGARSAPATFLVATEDGTIAAWRQTISGNTAVIKVDRSTSNSIYKGLAIVTDASRAPMLFAADFHNGKIDAFDGNFQFLGSFTDPDVPDGFAPFNVRNVRGFLFATFAKQLAPDNEDDQSGAGNGYVDIFDTDGTLLRRFASQGALNSPWGLAVAPRRFGKFSHALLVGNFGDGRINAYELLTGKFLGAMTRSDGNPLVIPGLWALAFEKDEVPEKESLFTADRLYFTAGPNDEDDGIIGIIRPVDRSAR